MVKKKSKKGRKIVLYSLGLGFLGVGAVMTQGAVADTPSKKQQLSPAQRSMQQSPGKKVSRVSASQKNSNDRSAYQQTMKKLSPKNKTTFHTLSDNDQQRVVKAHQNGKHPQKELTKVLNEDQQQHNKSQNIYD